MLVLALGGASAVVLLVTEFLTLSYRTISIGACSTRVQNPDVCTTTAGSAHSHMLWLIALAVLAFSFGAAVGGSRPAAVAVLACGVAVLVIALAIDRSNLGDTRHLGVLYNGVKAHTGGAVATEIAGGLLALLAGLAGLARPRSGGR